MLPVHTRVPRLYGIYSLTLPFLHSEVLLILADHLVRIFALCDLQFLL